MGGHMGFIDFVEDFVDKIRVFFFLTIKKIIFRVTA